MDIDRALNWPPDMFTEPEPAIPLPLSTPVPMFATPVRFTLPPARLTPPCRPPARIENDGVFNWPPDMFSVPVPGALLLTPFPMQIASLGAVTVPLSKLKTPEPPSEPTTMAVPDQSLFARVNVPEVFTLIVPVPLTPAHEYKPPPTLKGRPG